MKFEKGKSGNPSGRPKIPQEVRDLARAHTEKAIRALARVLTDKDANASAVTSAAVALLDRGWGKPTQHIDATIGFLDRLGHEDRVTLEAALVALERGQGDALEGDPATEH